MKFLSILAPAFGTAWLVTYLLARSGAKVKILDHPNERSLHHTPVPRTGGLAIWAGALVGTIAAVWLFGGSRDLAYIGAAALMIGAVSLLDDRFHVAVAVRLTIHLGAAVLLWFGGLGLQVIQLPGDGFDLHPGVGALLTVLFVVWTTNLYNFMDGIDGLAGGMAVFGFGMLGLFAYLAGEGYFAAISWAIAAAAGGFLVVNFPPARIFMGDAGASTLGLMAAALSLWGVRIGVFPLWVAILVFSPFIVDATVTVLVRAARMERIWVAHRRHYYQRLVQTGLGHRKTVLVEYALMVLCAVSAVVCLRQSVAARWAIVGFWTVAYVALIFTVEQLDKREKPER